MSTVINADIAKTGNSLKNLKEKYATSLGSQKEKFYYNKKLDSARIGGLLNSLKGLEAIGKTIAVINKDTTKTQVKNAEKNSLPKERLTSLGNDDIFLFNELIKKSYKLLGLITFLTTGPDETRAWTIHEGDKAPQAGGVIHSDFEETFIKAEVINWEKLIEVGGFAGAREKGFIRTEGKEYIVNDGDVIEIKSGK
jgi:ribosome-binding ATPase YchF (GTP1/OBG family)